MLQRDENVFFLEIKMMKTMYSLAKNTKFLTISENLLMLPFVCDTGNVNDSGLGGARQKGPSSKMQIFVQDAHVVGCSE